MRTQPFTPAEASTSERAPLYAFAASLEQLGLPQGMPEALFLRFEPMGQLSTTKALQPHPVGVLATWRSRSLATGAVDHVRPLTGPEAKALIAACHAANLPVINNVMRA